MKLRTLTPLGVFALAACTPAADEAQDSALTQSEARAMEGVDIDTPVPTDVRRASIIVRGLRAVADFEYEYQMVGMNRAMDDTVETVFLMAEARHQAIASKLVKEIARLGGDVSKFVTPDVESALKARLA